jgi:Concanavalin A-like lectin/glucanases superfamily
MAFANGGRIVTDGLVLSLDAADQNSYVSSSTTWKDLSINNLAGSITSATYNSSNNGSLVFNGTNAVVDFTNPSVLQITSGSISIWFKGVQTPAVAGGGFNGLITKQVAWGLFMSGSLLVTYDWGNNITRATTANIGDFNWYNACMTFSETTGTPSNNAIIYLNGVAILTTTIKNSFQSIGLQIGNGGNAQQQYMSGSVGAAQIYNRVLSAAEVLQNYNALKSRFNLT